MPSSAVHEQKDGTSSNLVGPSRTGASGNPVGASTSLKKPVRLGTESAGFSRIGTGSAGLTPRHRIGTGSAGLTPRSKKKEDESFLNSRSFAFAQNSCVADGELQVVANYKKRGTLRHTGAAYYEETDIEKYHGTSYIGVSYQVSSLSLICSITESFRAVLDLNFFYRIEDEDKEEYERLQKKGSIVLQEVIDQKKVKVTPPVFEIRNAVETPEESSGRVSNIQRCYDHRQEKEGGDGRWSWYVNVYQQIRVECYEEFEMHSFPFTRNALQITLQCRQPMAACMFVPLNSRSALPHWRYDEESKEVKEVFRRPNSVKVDKGCGNWRIEQHHLFVAPDKLLPPMPSGNKFSTCVVCVQCRQDSVFYLANTMTFTIGLPILCIFCLAEDPTAIADRMSIVLTMLLTMSTYKIVISDWIPQKDYLTLMDYYVLSGFLVTLLIAFIVAGVTWLTEFFPDEADQQVLQIIERVVLLVIVGGWISLHLYIWVGCMRDKFYKTWEELLCDENTRLEEIAGEVSAEREEILDVKLLSAPEPDVPEELFEQQ